jgi:hypothetical protein
MWSDVGCGHAPPWSSRDVPERQDHGEHPLGGRQPRRSRDGPVAGVARSGWVGRGRLGRVVSRSDVGSTARAVPGLVGWHGVAVADGLVEFDRLAPAVGVVIADPSPARVPMEWASRHTDVTVCPKPRSARYSAQALQSQSSSISGNTFRRYTTSGSFTRVISSVLIPIARSAYTPRGTRQECG